MYGKSFMLIQICGIFNILNLLNSCHFIRALTQSKFKKARQQLSLPIYQLSENYLTPISTLQWVNVKPLANYDYVPTSNVEKRNLLNNKNANRQREIRSPLGTMRFGKRNNSPLSTMRFGKRDTNNSPFGTMRFGKRDNDNLFLELMQYDKRNINNSPLGTMRFGKRDVGYSPFETMLLDKPLGTMRFKKRSINEQLR